MLPIYFGFELFLTGDPSSFGHNLVVFVHFGSAPIHLVEQSILASFLTLGTISQCGTAPKVVFKPVSISMKRVARQTKK